MATYQMRWDAGTGGYDTSMWSPEQWQAFGASGGTVGNNGELLVNGNALNTNQIGTGNALTNALGMNDNNMLGLSSQQWSGLGTLGGLATQAIALPSRMHYYNTQTDLAKQQIAYNKAAMQDKQNFNKTWANASNGLAASSLAVHFYTIKCSG